MITLKGALNLNELNGSIVLAETSDLCVCVDSSCIKEIGDGASIYEVGFKEGSVAFLSGEGGYGARGGALGVGVVDE